MFQLSLFKQKKTAFDKNLLNVVEHKYFFDVRSIKVDVKIGYLIKKRKICMHSKNKIMKSIFALLFVGFFALVNLKGQKLEVVSAAGDSYENSGYTISWTLGEVASETFSNGSALEITQGFQQPSIIITAIDEVKDNGVHMVAYPNPTLNIVYIKFESDNFNDCSFSIYDMNGKILSCDKIKNTTQIIDLTSYPSAQYVLKVVDKDGLTIKAFKIFKN